MQNVVEIRDIRLGEGIPKICVPLVAKTKDEFLNLAEALEKIKLDLVEVRIDHFEDVENIQEVKSLLKDLRDILKNIPILFTFRSLKEGGEKRFQLNTTKL